MKQVIKIVFAFTLLVLGVSSFTANEKNTKQKYHAFLGCSYTDSVQISVEEFNQLVAKNLCVKDSANNLYKVESFEIVYAERGLYQDEEGLPIIVTDYSNVLCNGDTIPQNWQKSFMQRGYKGDTVYFDKVQIHTKENRVYQCKSIKVVLK